MHPVQELCAKVCEEIAAECRKYNDSPHDEFRALVLLRAAREMRALPQSAITAAINEPTRQLCIQACEEVAKRIPHGAVDCIAAIKAIPQSEIDGAVTLHASALAGYRCADCLMVGEACPTCYKAWWTKRHQNHHETECIPAALPEGYVTKENVVAALEKECADGDRLCEALGTSRTEGGSLNIPKMLAVIRARQNAGLSSVGGVTIPVDVAKLIRKVFLPANPRKMRSAHPDTLAAINVFIEALRERN